MDIQFYGANCVSLALQGARLVVDDNLAELGAKPVTKAGDIALFTGAHGEVPVDTKLTIDCPGEYEVSEFAVQGIPARAHIDEAGTTNITVYKITANDTSVLVLGHIYPELNDTDLEKIGMVDVLITPVGGNGYTLDPTGALNLIKKIEPKVIIPTHYADQVLNYPVPQQTLEDALKALAMEPKQATGKLRIKAGTLPEVAELIVLEKV